MSLRRLVYLGIGGNEVNVAEQAPELVRKVTVTSWEAKRRRRAEELLGRRLQELRGKGRHDPCVLPRAAPMVRRLKISRVVSTAASEGGSRRVETTLLI